MANSGDGSRVERTVRGMDGTKTKTEVVYIAGPMEGYENFNFPAFNAAAERLRDLGYDVRNPAANGDINAADPNKATKPREWYLKRDLEWLLECDMVLVLEGWEMSRGARMEVQVARNLGLRIVRFGDALDGVELEDVEYETVLEEALRIAGGGDRQKQYGHPLYNMSRTAQILSAILGIEVTAEQAALCLIGVKIARESFKPHRDNVVDIGGYALVLEQVQRGREVIAKGGTLPNVRRNGDSEYPE